MARNKNREKGRAHRRRRALLLSLHKDAEACWWCAQPMWRDPTRNWDRNVLNADHTVARAHQPGGLPDRLLHETCNKQRGDGARDHLRPAIQNKPANILEW